MTTKRSTDAAQPHSRISDDRVAELLQIAGQVFAERGFDGASVNEMAKRASASKGTFYSRYPTKRDLLMAVVAQQVRGMETELADALAPGLDLAEALTKFADRILSLVLSKEVLANYRVVTLEAQRFPELGKVYYENGAEKVAHFFAAYLAQKVREGKLKIANPRITAELFIDSIVGMPRLKTALGVGSLSRNKKAERIEIAVEAFLTAYGSR